MAAADTLDGEPRAARGAVAGKVGASLVLLNTAFAGPQLVEVLGRERVDVLIYDQEYAGALDSMPAGPFHVIAWEDERAEGPTVDFTQIAYP
jgi:fatty-acyl-CoA synthase